MRNWIRYTVYLFVAAQVFCAHAGSHEDFFIAVKRNDGRTIQQLLERGFDPNTRTQSGDVGLILALKGEDAAVVDALLASQQTRVDIVNDAGESPLMMSALRGNHGLCVRLIARGAPINKPGWTPLHYAATGPDARVVALLLERGAVVDAEAPNRTTPLMMAARHGPEESVKLLLARGADRKRTNDLNQTAADLARSGGREWLAEMLSKP